MQNLPTTMCDQSRYIKRGADCCFHGRYCNPIFGQLGIKSCQIEPFTQLGSIVWLYAQLIQNLIDSRNFIRQFGHGVGDFNFVLPVELHFAVRLNQFNE